MEPTALVVGGSSVIGTSIAAALIDVGYQVRLWGRSPSRLRAAAESCGSEVSVETVDVADRDAVAAALGGPALVEGGGVGCGGL